MKRSHLIAFLLAGLAAGCGKKNDSLANRAGESLGKHLTDFGKGVGKGIDHEMMVRVTLQPALAELGLTNTIAKSLGLDYDKKGISVYFVASHSVSNNLVARALNADGMEIGRSRQPLVMAAQDAAYVNFTFPAEMDSAMVQEYEIGL